MKYYTGKEWKEKWKKENPRFRMREEPHDSEIIDENGTPVSCDGLLLILFVIAAVGIAILSKLAS